MICCIVTATLYQSLWSEVDGTQLRECCLHIVSGFSIDDCDYLVSVSLLEPDDLHALDAEPGELLDLLARKCDCELPCDSCSPCEYDRKSLSDGVYLELEFASDLQLKVAAAWAEVMDIVPEIENGVKSRLPHVLGEFGVGDDCASDPQILRRLDHRTSLDLQVEIAVYAVAASELSAHNRKPAIRAIASEHGTSNGSQYKVAVRAAVKCH
jgi:hypothetical protein